MSKFVRADDEVKELAHRILDEFESHQPTVFAKVTIDFLFAYGDQDDNGETIKPALTCRGVRALGMCRIVNLRDRAKGLADVEITLDADHWGKIDPDEQRAILDHELHHILVVEGKTDDLGRPKIKMRKHDVEFGWFRTIAARHGVHSQERIQATYLIEENGQYFFPDIASTSAEAIGNTPEIKKLAASIRNSGAKLKVLNG